MAVLLTGLFASCQKDAEKTIAFGNTKGMKVESYDTHIDLGKTLALDVDADGTDDLSFISYYDGPMQMDIQTLYLDCLRNEVELFGEIVEMEGYRHRDTIIDVFEGDTTYHYLYVYNTCEKISDNDEILISRPFMPSANDINGVFNIDNYFSSEKVILFRENTSAIGQTYIYDCDNFPTNTEKYIGFKITKDNTSRLGWLKLNLIGDETVNVHLIETAIQK